MKKIRLWLGGALLLGSGGCLPDNFWQDIWSGVVEAASDTLLTQILTALGLG